MGGHVRHVTLNVLLLTHELHLVLIARFQEILLKYKCKWRDLVTWKRIYHLGFSTLLSCLCHLFLCTIRASTNWWQFATIWPFTDQSLQRKFLCSEDCPVLPGLTIMILQWCKSLPNSPNLSTTTCTNTKTPLHCIIQASVDNAMLSNKDKLAN